MKPVLEIANIMINFLFIELIPYDKKPMMILGNSYPLYVRFFTTQHLISNTKEIYINSVG